MREVRDSDRRREGTGHAGEAREKLKKENVGGQKGEILASSPLPASHTCVCVITKAGKRKGSRYSGGMEEAKKEGRQKLWDSRREKRGNDVNRKDKKEEVVFSTHPSRKKFP